MTASFLGTYFCIPIIQCCTHLLFLSPKNVVNIHITRKNVVFPGIIIMETVSILGNRSKMRNTPWIDMKLSWWRLIGASSGSVIGGALGHFLSREVVPSEDGTSPITTTTTKPIPAAIAAGMAVGAVIGSAVGECVGEPSSPTQN